MNKIPKKKAVAAGSDASAVEEPTSMNVCAGGYGRTAPGVHDFRGGPTKGRRWCIKLGCGAWEPRRTRARKAKEAGA